MKPKVGVVIDPWDYPYNGTVVSTRRFVAALAEHLDFHLLAIGDEYRPENHPIGEPLAGSQKVPFKKLSLPGFNHIIDGMKVPLASPGGTTRVRAALMGLDLVHMQFPFFLGAAVCREARRQAIPLICSFHVQPENLQRNLGINSKLVSTLLYKLFIWAMYRHADLVITPSQFAADELIKHGLQTPVEVLSNGVPDEFFELCDRRGNHEKFQIMSVGRMAPEKQQAVILEAINQSRFRSRIALRLIGTGPMEQEIIARAKRLGIDAEIGPVDDETLRRCYQSADLFIHAGEIELEGMSVLEAMAAGNAVVVSDAPTSAATNFVQSEHATFRNRDACDLRVKIDYWLENTELRTAAGLSNRHYAGQYQHGTSAEQLLKIYQRFLPS